MKSAHIQKLHDTVSVTGARCGGSRHWRIEDITVERGHSIHNNNPEEI